MPWLRRYRMVGCPSEPTISWSIPPATSWWAGLTVTAASPAARSSWIPMAAIRPPAAGVFPDKDPTKVDRSAAYAARYLAKNVVAAGVAERCTIQIAYAIGISDPMSLLVDTHGTGKVDERKLEKALPEILRLTPTNIRRTLKLNRPIYRRTAAYGHFGRAPEKDGGFSWEKTDLVKDIRMAVG